MNILESGSGTAIVGLLFIILIAIVMMGSKNSKKP